MTNIIISLENKLLKTCSLFSFPDDPLTFLVELRTTNQHKTDGAAGWQGMDEILIDSKTMKPGCYVNPLLSGASLISKLGISLDGINLQVKDFVVS